MTNSSYSSNLRVGTGYDSHRFGGSGPLILAGVKVPSERGLVGHSDADVLTHAVIDAVLGAAGLGDIGQHFPDSDERWRDASSIELAGSVAGLLSKDRITVVNIDATVLLEEPKLTGLKEEMAANLAAAFEIDATSVSVKATTGEGMGFVGRGEGAAAQAVALVERA